MGRTNESLSYPRLDRRDDVLSAYRTLHDRSRTPMTLTNFPPWIGFFAGASMISGSPMALSAYIGPSMAAVIGNMHGREARARDAVNSMQKGHIDLEKKLGVSFDIVALPSKDKTRPTYAMRLYDVGDQESLSAKDVAIIQNVATWCKDKPIGQLLVGANWMKADDVNYVVENGGQILDATTALTDLKGPKFKDVIRDNQVSGSVVSMSPDKLLTYAVARSVDAKRELLERIGNHNWTQLFNRGALDQLELEVRLAAERILGGEAMAATENTEYGPMRKRISVAPRIRGDHLVEELHSNSLTGHSEVSQGDTAHLLRYVGASSLEDLIDADGRSGADEYRDLLVALYLSLRENKVDLPAGSHPIPLEERTESLALRLDPDFKINPTYDYDAKPVGRITRRLAGTALVGLAVFGLGAGVNHVGPELVGRDAAYMSEYRSSQNNGEFSGDMFGQDYGKYLNFLRVEYGVESVAQRHLAELYGGLKAVDRMYLGLVETTLSKMLGLGGSGLNGGFGFETTEFGDVLNPHDKTSKFHIESLTGASLKGYWMATATDALTVSEAGQKRSLIADNWTFYYVKERSSWDNPDISVTIPINGDELTVPMPVRWGTEVLSVHLVDLDQEDSPSLRELRWGEYRGAHTAFIGSGNTYPEGVSRLGVRYYLSEIGDIAFPAFPPKDAYPHRGTQVRVYEKADDRYGSYGKFREATSLELQEIASRTRQALKLGPDASAEEVVEAIRNSKAYSYTPLANNGAGSSIGANAQLDDIDALSEIGTALAELDSMNCNIAALTAFLGALDREDRELSIATGFNNDEDDKSLSVDELHAWLVDARGAVLDPTPSFSGLGEPNDREKDLVDNAIEAMPITAAGLLLAATSIVAYRRREEIAAARDRRRVKKLDGETMHAAVESLVNMLYAQPGQPLPTVGSGVYDNPAWRRYYNNVGSDFTVSAKDIAGLPPRVKKAIRQLQAGRKAVARHIERQS